MSKSFEKAAQEVLEQALQLRKEHGEPEAIDLATYTNEKSLRKAGIQELSLKEHQESIEYIASILAQHGFATNLYTVPEES